MSNNSAGSAYVSPVSDKDPQAAAAAANSDIKISLRNTPSAMVDLIPTVNKLQDVFHSIYHMDNLDLPQIVVVGSQSSGKSSVLENIVQKDFLPRGKEIVTRRPLVLQLINTSAASSNSDTDWAEFLHLPNERFTDFALVKAEIERETERVAGTNKGISRVPIHLKIFSQKVLNLTLVDLPGITKIPIGEQPPDIELKIKKLVLEYISKPNSIILAVSPANQDIVNSESLKLAREVDPEGKRTVGVLTKLDLMDAGTNAYDVLTGKQLPLRMGFVGIVNRSQQDINDSKAIAEALKAEETYFRNSVAYRSISSKCGTPYLTKTLNMILMHHIREKLPELKNQLNLLIVQAEQELASYGDATFTGKNHQGSLVLRLLTKFASNFNSSIDGTNTEISINELCGGARLYYIFNTIFGQSLEKIDPCSNLSTNDIRTAIRNSTGPRPSLFIPELAFDLLIKPQLKRLETPSLRCVELVFDELLKIVNASESKELTRFPKLHQRVMDVVVELLRERMMPTQAYIESLISVQLAYINTNHPDFIGGGAAIAQLERKHDRRRRDIERKKVVGGSSTGGLPTMANGHDATHLPSSLSKARDIPVHQQSHGKDGGFLTYFFGNHPAGSPEPYFPGNSRSSSPTRQAEKDDSHHDYASIRSTDDAIFASTQHASNLNKSPSPPLLNEKEEMEVELIKSLITSYFNVTRKTIADIVPKTIMHLVVNHSKENIQNRLVSTLYKEELFGELLMEDERVLREREKCKELLEIYRRGAIVLQDIF